VSLPGLNGLFAVRGGDHRGRFRGPRANGRSVTLFLSQSINARLWPELLRELKPGARVVSHRFEMPRDWKADQDISVQGTHVLLWTIR
jgi:hypothetical protein